MVNDSSPSYTVSSSMAMEMILEPEDRKLIICVVEE